MGKKTGSQTVEKKDDCGHEEEIADLYKALDGKDDVIKIQEAEWQELHGKYLEATKPARFKRVLAAEDFGGQVDDKGKSVCDGCLHIGGGMSRGVCGECAVAVEARASKFADVADLLQDAEKAGVKVEVGPERNLVVDGDGPVVDALEKHAAAVVRKLRGL
jgi:hypothetical protein